MVEIFSSVLCKSNKDSSYPLTIILKMDDFTFYCLLGDDMKWLVLYYTRQPLKNL